MASAASYCCTIQDIMDFDPNDRVILDSTFDSKFEKDIKDRLIEVYRYDGITDKDVFFTANSTSQAIDNVCKGLLGPGDEMIVTVPIWPQFAAWDNEESRFMGLPFSGLQNKVHTLPLKMEDGWAYPLEELKERISSHTKLIAIQTPGHNPTGNDMDLNAVCEIAEDAGVYLLHDEIYRGLELDAPFSCPPAVNLYENAVVVNSLSKSLGLEGLRLGWIASRNKEVMEKSVGAGYWGRGKQHFFMQIAYHSFDLEKYMRLLEEKRQIQAQAWFVITQWINSHSNIFEWVPPDAAYIAFPRFNLNIDSWSLCIKLLNEYDTLVVPGICYGFDNHIRIGCGKTTVPNVISGLQQIDKCLETLT